MASMVGILQHGVSHPPTGQLKGSMTQLQDGVQVGQKYDMRTLEPSAYRPWLQSQ